VGAPGETSFNCPAPESESPGTSLDQGEVARRVFIVGSSGEEARRGSPVNAVARNPHSIYLSRGPKTTIISGCSK
jgi:hypothetical protein